MIIFLIRLAIYVGSSALGLLVATWLLPDFRLQWGGVVIAVLVFAVAQSLLTPFVAVIAKRYIPALLGGIGLIAVFVSLLVAQLFPGGLTVSGWRTWVLGSIVVWLVVALATALMPALFLKKRLAQRKASA